MVADVEPEPTEFEKTVILGPEHADSPGAADMEVEGRPRSAGGADSGDDGAKSPPLKRTRIENSVGTSGAE